MSWQVLIGLSIVLEAFGRITQRVMMKGEKSDPIASAIVYQLAAGIIFAITALAVGFEIPDLRPLIPYLLVTPILWGTMNIFVFKSLQSTEASVFTILFAMRTLIVILLSIVFLDETFTPVQAAGTLLILIAVVLVSWKKQALQLKRGEIYALVAAVFIAIGSVNDSYIARTVPVLPYLAYNFFFSGIFVLLLNPRALRRVIATTKEKSTISSAILLAFIYAGSAGTALTAYQVGRNAAQLGAVYPISNILVVVLAVLFLKERTRLLIKLLAVILSVAGVVLVS